MCETDTVVRHERNSAGDKTGFKADTGIDCVGVAVLDIVLSVIFLMGVAQVGDDVNFFARPSSVKVDTVPMRVKL